MKKKYSFFLLPVIVMLLSFTGWHIHFFAQSRAGRIAVISEEGGLDIHPDRSTVSGNNGHHISSKIRIKAWDRYFVAELTPKFEVAASAPATSVVVYGDYDVYSTSAYFTSFSLRGPPISA